MKFKFTELHKLTIPKSVLAEDNSVFLFYGNDIATEMKFNVEDFRNNIILLSNNFMKIMGTQDWYIKKDFGRLYPRYKLKKQYPMKLDMYSYSYDFCCYEISK